MSASKSALKERPSPHAIVRYDELRACRDAFIDTRTPGSDQKENFTIVGPGVSENPNQFVHIAEPHGFNIGGARQPPGCLNSQHSHDTVEVFYVHQGTWRFMSGETAEDGEVILRPGDLISLPTKLFRGFENIGEDVGFLFAVLGGDDPGRVLWAPDVFDLAKDYGLLLLENGSLVDLAAGQEPPADVGPMPRTSPDQIAALTKVSSADLETCVLRSDSLVDLMEAPHGVAARPLIGPEPLNWEHGFTVTELRLKKDHSIGAGALGMPEVWFVQSGSILVSGDHGVETITANAGDTISLQRESGRGALALSDATIVAVRGGDDLRAAEGTLQ